MIRARNRLTRRVALGAIALLALATAAGGSQPAAAAAPAAPCTLKTAHPWCDRSLTPDRRAQLFVAAMTTDEKIQLLGGQGTTNNGIVPGGHTGATYAVPRLGLPAVYFSDGPVGVRQGSATAMPVPQALAASFDESLGREYGALIADEAKKKGNDVVFAPSVNLERNPQNGRTYEAYGEETYLVSRTGVQFIDGVQSTGVIADVKHYAANNQEGQLGLPPFTALQGSRTMVNANIDERTLHEVYLPHFEAAVKQAHVGTLMCSYNKVNGTHACQNPTLLQDILRKQWGFQGTILSDYAAASHQQPDDTARNLNSGLDFVPAQGSLDQSYAPALIQAAMANGQVTLATIGEHDRRILRTLFGFGYFDRPGYVDNGAAINVTAHELLAQTVEERAITLLKNNGVLPLSGAVKKIAVIGPYADRYVTGGGSGGVTPRSVVTALQGITARAGKGVTVTYADGSDQAAAAALARAADVAVVVVGDVQTEGQDKSCLGLNCSSDLSGSNSILLTSGRTCVQTSCPLNGTDQDGLINAVAAAQKRTVVTLETGGPVLTPWRAKVAAVVEAWYPGDRGGAALARVLFGDVDPGGRLPATFPASAAQLPTAGKTDSYPGVLNEETYAEKLLVGYRWYDAKHLAPAYPFGAGLSYTTFRYGPLTVKGAKGANQVAVATMAVTNTGKRNGVAVPQLYISKPTTAALPQPVRQLVGYASVNVPAGRTVRVTFPLNDRSFASWAVDPFKGWTITPGCYQLAAGASSRALPSHATVGRGATCGAAPRLTTTGDFRLPLPAAATTQLVAAASPPIQAPAPARPDHGSGTSLPATGSNALLALAGLLALCAATAVHQRRRSS